MNNNLTFVKKFRPEGSYYSVDIYRRQDGKYFAELIYHDAGPFEIIDFPEFPEVWNNIDDLEDAFIDEFVLY